MNKTHLDILMPVYNAEATLPTCLKSLSRQSEKRWVCWAIDDGSSDQSAQILQDAALRDSRIRVIFKKHEGIVPALNAGLTHCRAPWVARMDADDWMHRDRLALQLSALENNPQLSAVGSHVRVFPRDRMTQGARRYEAWLNRVRNENDLRAEAWVECPVAHPSLMFRTEALTASGYQDPEWPEDYDLILRFLAQGKRIGMVPRRLIGWRDSASRLSRTHPRYHLDAFTQCKAFHLTQTFLASHPHYVLWGHGPTGRSLRRALAQHGRATSHIVEVHPRRIGQTLQGAPVVVPEDLLKLRPERIIVSVAGASARSKIREALDEMGFQENQHYVCTA
ncbi:MAG: glycosyltransferase [Myxococcota bacterium]|nr:glycosyltransferase [Myxococcota bacterium]